MELRVLAVGDVVGDGGLQCLEQHLRSLKKLYRIDFCVANSVLHAATAPAILTILLPILTAPLPYSTTSYMVP